MDAVAAPPRTFDDLRTFLAACQEIDDWRQIDGADWDLEIGALTEATAELMPGPPMLLFDNIKDYPPGYRVASLPLGSHRGGAGARPADRHSPKLELVRLAARKVRDVEPIPPRRGQRRPAAGERADGRRRGRAGASPRRASTPATAGATSAPAT